MAYLTPLCNISLRAPIPLKIGPLGLYSMVSYSNPSNTRPLWLNNLFKLLEHPR